MERGRLLGGREGVVGVAFGPGITVEMVLLKRMPWKGREVDAGRGDVEDGGKGTVDGVNGVKGVSGGVSVNGYDQEEKVEAIVEEAKANLAGGHVNGDDLPKRVDGKRSEANEEGDMANMELNKRVEAEVGRCTCLAPSLRFRGSGLDCWCRS